MIGNSASAFFYALLIVLPLSALVARRIPMKSAAKMALAWIAIFAVLLVAVGQRERFAALWSEAQGLLGDNDQRVSGGVVRIDMASDGHFYATAQINGVRRRMLIDSGATTTALSSATAKAANIDLGESPFPTIIDTANGQVSARVATARLLTVGDIDAHDLGVVVSPAFGDSDVLGMNFLSRLRSWRVEGRTLILQPTSK